jgi:hypothetical protein
MRDTTKLREFIMSTVREGGGIESLAAKVLELQTPDKLRLAADLLLVNKVDMAEAIATRAVQEMQLVMLFDKKKDKR